MLPKSAGQSSDLHTLTPQFLPCATTISLSRGILACTATSAELLRFAFDHDITLRITLQLRLHNVFIAHHFRPFPHY